MEPVGVLGSDGQQGSHRGEEHQHSLSGEEARVVPPLIAVFSQRTAEGPDDAWRCTVFFLVIDELLRAKSPLLGGVR